MIAIVSANGIETVETVIGIVGGRATEIEIVAGAVEVVAVAAVVAAMATAERRRTIDTS